jgi:hypothetical protein
MLVRAPLVEAEQDGSIRIQDLTKVVMARRRLGLAKERLVPFEATWDVAYANDRPCAFHRISAVGLTPPHQPRRASSTERRRLHALLDATVYPCRDRRCVQLSGKSIDVR